MTTPVTQAVILAAGVGKRMQPLTRTTPKPLIPILGKPILRRIIGELPPSIEEIVIVIEYLGDQIIGEVRSWNLPQKIYFVWQEQKGTFGALYSARHLLADHFLVVLADDLITSDNFSRMITFDTAVLVAWHKHPEHFGVIVQNADGSLASIIEQPSKPPSHLVNTGTMVLPLGILDCAPGVRGEELLLTPAVTELAKKHRVDIYTASTWIPVGRPEDIPVAERRWRRLRKGT